MTRAVVALYVDLARGPYPGLGVDCWGRAVRDGSQPGLFSRDRDARTYAGPHPVVAHPPCGPWGRFYWNYKGGEGARSCGPTAVEQVRRFGGVLEHPSESGLWAACGLPLPGAAVDGAGGWTLEVQQCDWGHPARKRTWLYVVGITARRVPDLPPTSEPTHVMVRLHRNNNDWPEVPKRDRHITPPAFAEWLVDCARRVAE